jgi:hypothetical protein
MLMPAVEITWLILLRYVVNTQLKTTSVRLRARGVEPKQSDLISAPMDIGPTTEEHEQASDGPRKSMSAWGENSNEGAGAQRTRTSALGSALSFG